MAKTLRFKPGDMAKIRNTPVTRELASAYIGTVCDVTAFVDDPLLQRFYHLDYYIKVCSGEIAQVGDEQLDPIVDPDPLEAKVDEVVDENEVWSLPT